VVEYRYRLIVPRDKREHALHMMGGADGPMMPDELPPRDGAVTFDIYTRPAAWYAARSLRRRTDRQLYEIAMRCDGNLTRQRISTLYPPRHQRLIAN
jgi:hypothetical protein